MRRREGDEGGEKEGGEGGEGGDVVEERKVREVDVGWFLYVFMVDEWLN